MRSQDLARRQALLLRCREGHRRSGFREVWAVDLPHDQDAVRVHLDRKELELGKGRFAVAEAARAARLRRVRAAKNADAYLLPVSTAPGITPRASAIP